MRVITGSARGRVLAELPGLETRPTTGKMKEGLFSALQFDIEGRRVLDLFSGTGQLGIEALSRGAAFCDFVDRNPAALAVTEKNVNTCGFQKQAGLYRLDWDAFLDRCKEKYGLIFLDPPYHSGDLEKAMMRIAEIDILVGNGIMACESPTEDVLPELPDPYEKKREYRYSRSKITLYRRRATL